MVLQTPASTINAGTASPTASAAASAAASALPQLIPPVSLTKHYKGITLDQPVRILEISPECATIQATQRQTFPCLDGKIHLRSGAFAGAITAYIQPVDYTQGTFLLSDLAFTHWQDRQTERVQPKYPTYVSLYNRRQAYRAFMEDISVDGVGLLADKAIDPEGFLRVGAKIDLDFNLMPEHPLSHLKGMLIYRQKVGRQLVKFGLHLYPNIEQKYALQEYIRQRREEILDELDVESARLRQPHRVENLYF